MFSEHIQPFIFSGLTITLSLNYVSLIKTRGATFFCHVITSNEKNPIQIWFDDHISHWFSWWMARAVESWRGLSTSANGWWWSGVSECPSLSSRCWNWPIVNMCDLADANQDPHTICLPPPPPPGPLSHNFTIILALMMTMMMMMMMMMKRWQRDRGDEGQRSDLLSPEDYTTSWTLMTTRINIQFSDDDHCHNLVRMPMHCHIHLMMMMMMITSLLTLIRWIIQSGCGSSGEVDNKDRESRFPRSQNI